MRSDDATTREVAKDFVQRHIEWLKGQLELYGNDPDSDIAGEIAIYQYLATLAAEVERVKGAVRWALGEGDSDFGASLGDRYPGDGKLPRIGRYWWRTELRKRAGFDATRGETTAPAAPAASPSHPAGAPADAGESHPAARSPADG